MIYQEVDIIAKLGILGYDINCWSVIHFVLCVFVLCKCGLKFSKVFTVHEYYQWLLRRRSFPIIMNNNPFANIIYMYFVFSLTSFVVPSYFQGFNFCCVTDFLFQLAIFFLFGALEVYYWVKLMCTCTVHECGRISQI